MLTSPLKPEATKTNRGALAFIFEKLLSEKTFIEIVTVVASNPTTQTIDVKPLVCRADPYNNSISNSVVYGVTYLRWQCGGSAIIMDPVAGDIGLLLVTDRDSSAVRLSRLEAQPTTKETHSRSDGVYLGGLLNMNPTQFIELKNGSINITTPDSVNISCKDAIINATEGITLDTPLAKFTGDIIDNASSNKSTLKDLREKFNAHQHTVNGVESGSSQVDSDKPNNPTE
jgi:phage gp45-like